MIRRVVVIVLLTARLPSSTQTFLGPCLVRTGSLSDRFTQLALQQQKAFKNTSIGGKQHWSASASEDRPLTCHGVLCVAGTESRRVTIQGQQQFKREAMQNVSTAICQGSGLCP